MNKSFRVVYVPLEPYKERYTLQLKEWNIREFKRLKVDYVIVDGVSLDRSNEIKIGHVLDAHQRSYFALSQVQKIVEMHYKGEITPTDFILFEDMFHPGIEALAYIFGLAANIQQKAKPKIGVRCLAQTIDPDDFVHYSGIANWMRSYEQMVNKFVDVIFAASEEMVSFMTAAGWDVPVYVTGLPFGKQEVLERYGNALPKFRDRADRVVFASRVANEKQLGFFLEIAKQNRVYKSSASFAILSGGRISHPAIDQAVIKYGVKIYANLSKEEYYSMLASSKVLFNCSLQDWVSNTVSEADTLGCNLVFPAYRSFPEVFKNDHTRMYVPWSLSDAMTKLHDALSAPHPKRGEVSDDQDGSIARTIDIIDSIMDPMNVAWTNSSPIRPATYRKRILDSVLTAAQSHEESESDE